MVSVKDLYWAAGFMEGEGSFVLRSYETKRGTGGSAVLCAGQVQREPLERLQRIFGGKISEEDRSSRGQPLMHRWTICGAPAVGISMTLFGLMSPRRQSQIKVMLAGWRKDTAKVLISHCKNGHEYNQANTYVYADGRRRCKPCGAEHMRRKRAKLRKEEQANG